MKKILLFLVATFMFVAPVCASHTVNFERKGSISLTLIEQDHQDKVKNANIEIIKIADAKNDDTSNLSYDYVRELSSCNVDLSDLNKVNVDDVIDCLNDEVKTISNKTDSNGEVSFENLDLGLYLIRQTNLLDEYSSIDPYLVTVPTIMDNSWVYDIESEPKTEISKYMNIIINIEWKTEKNIDNKKVNVELFDDETLVNKYLITKDDAWQHKDRVLSSDKYNVKGEELEGFNISYVIDGNTFTIIYSDKLPQTGQPVYIIYILAFVGMTFIALGININKDEKNK